MIFAFTGGERMPSFVSGVFGKMNLLVGSGGRGGVEAGEAVLVRMDKAGEAGRDGGLLTRARGIDPGSVTDLVRSLGRAG